MIEKVYDIIGILTRDKGMEISLSEFNILANKANIEYFRNIFGYITTGEKEEVNKDFTEKTKRFRKIESITLDSEGYSDIPDNYFRYADLYYISGNRRIQIDVCTIKEFSKSMSSYLYPPTKEFPKAEFIDNKIHIEPKDLENIKLIYYRYPQEVEYVERIIHGVNVYDSDKSKDFEFTEECIVDIIRLILIDLNITINNASIISYLEQKKNIET